MKKRLRSIGFLLLLLLPCAEIAARIVGWGPIENVDYKVEATPENWLVGDSVYGIALNPGSYSVTLNDSLNFSTKHKADGTRFVTTNDSSEQKISFFGCSFTYGYGVDVDFTFAGRLANQFPEFTIENYGVPGHGTVQNWLRLKQLIKKGNQPDCAILVYSKEHLDRNVMNTSYRKALKIGFQNSNQSVNSNMKTARFPFFKDTTLSSVKYTNWENCYSNWWGRDKLAIVHALQSSFSDNDEIEQTNEITEALLKDFERICRENNIKFLLVNLDDDEFKSRFPNLNPANYISIGFDFSNADITNAPHDNHPNAAGHELISQKISPLLKNLLNEKE